MSNARIAVILLFGCGIFPSVASCTEPIDESVWERIENGSNRERIESIKKVAELKSQGIKYIPTLLNLSKTGDSDFIKACFEAVKTIEPDLSDAIDCFAVYDSPIEQIKKVLDSDIARKHSESLAILALQQVSVLVVGSAEKEKERIEFLLNFLFQQQMIHINSEMLNVVMGWVSGSKQGSVLFRPTYIFSPKIRILAIDISKKFLKRPVKLSDLEKAKEINSFKSMLDSLSSDKYVGDAVRKAIKEIESTSK